jgi:phospholipid/cholesterol/gamma-HCH transport system substrate-binding protein
MKNSKLSPERIAGTFVIGTLVLGLFGLGVLGWNQGWIDSRIKYVIYLTNASDVSVDTKVEISGLRVGKVDSITLESRDRVKVIISVRKKFADQIFEGTSARLLRPFILGEKSIELIPGSSLILMKDGSQLAVANTLDPLDIVTGPNLGKNLDHLAGILQNLDELSAQANQKGELKQIISNINSLTYDLKKATPYYTVNAERMSKDVTSVVHELSELSKNINAMMPVVKELARGGPEQAQLLTQTMRETSLLIRAMQRVFLIRGKVEEIKEEEKRVPAAENK